MSMPFTNDGQFPLRCIYIMFQTTNKSFPVVPLTQLWYKIGQIHPKFIGQALSCTNIGWDVVEPNILKLMVRPINIGFNSSNFIIIKCRVQYYQILDTSKHNKGGNRSKQGEVRTKCKPVIRTDNNREHSDPYASFLLRQATKIDDFQRAYEICKF